MLGAPLLEYQMAGVSPAPPGNDDPDFAPHNNYPCAGEDSRVAITVHTETEWEAFSQAIDAADQFADPHLNARETNVGMVNLHIGAEMLYGVPWRFSDTPGGVRTPAPLLGKHNGYVLGELLGIDDDALARLADEQVVY